MKSKKSKRSELGEKARAGSLLSSFIRSIAQEQTTVKVGDEENPPKTISKAELLARQIWDRALGNYKEIHEDGKVKRYLPDKDMIHLIFDRMEGKAGSIDDTKRKLESLPDKMSRQNKERINKLAAES